MNNELEPALEFAIRVADERINNFGKPGCEMSLANLKAEAEVYRSALFSATGKVVAHPAGDPQ